MSNSEDSRNIIDSDDKQQFRRSLAEQGMGDTARIARSFARPQKPVRMKPRDFATVPRRPNEADRAMQDNAVRAPKVKPAARPLNDKAEETKAVRPANVSVPDETRHVRVREPHIEEHAPADETKRQPLVRSMKPADQGKGVLFDPPASEKTRRQPLASFLSPKKEGKAESADKNVKVAARNRQAAEMESIFRKDARITELPQSRSYFSFFSRLKRNGPSKRYRLKGYANREYVKQKRKRNRRIMRRANIIFWVMIALAFLFVFYWLNPIDKIQELLHLFGM